MTTIAANPSLVTSRSTGASRSAAKSEVGELRLTPRGRTVARSAVVASLSILLLSGFSMVSGASAGSERAKVSSPYMKITVKPGESLWSIAAKIDPSADRRDLVEELISINHLSSPTVEAGEKIFVPTR